MEDRHARHRRGGTDRRRRPVDGYRVRSRARFVRLVHDALSTLPEGLLEHLDGVLIGVEDVPLDVAGDRGGGELALGRYTAAARTRRGSPASQLPDRLTLFRRPLEARAVDRADLIGLVQETVVIELAIHLGLDEDRLDELGWS